MERAMSEKGSPLQPPRGTRDFYPEDLRFRNLDGTATWTREIGPDAGTLIAEGSRRLGRATRRGSMAVSRTAMAQTPICFAISVLPSVVTSGSPAATRMTG